VGVGEELVDDGVRVFEEGNRAPGDGGGVVLLATLRV